MEQQAISFEFSSYFYDLAAGNFSFTYKIQLANNESLSFTEKVLFPTVDLSTPIPNQLIDSLAHSLHLILGITYWKLYCPREIKIKTKPLTKDQAKFWNTVYTKGLGEFFYRNKIDFKDLIQFPYAENTTNSPTSFPRDEKALIGIGGGKDSIVVKELLAKTTIQQAAFVVEIQREQPLIDEVITAIKLPSLKITRLIDPLLFMQNRQPNVYNGHVPISAINAFFGLLTAVLMNYKYVVVGNEHSSDVGNVEWQGEIINHQWSKSVEFERLLQSYVNSYITPDVTYFSLLRPWYEIKIVEVFSKYSQYFSVFSSCNENFKIIKTNEAKWCGKCAKCCFIFSLLAAFIPKETLVGIFQKNLFADESLIKTFKELLGVEGIKPFDCVGTPEEVKVAFQLIHEKGEYSQDVVMQMFEKEVLPKINNIEELKKEVLSNHELSLIPVKFRSLL